jgi:hypothetical protein
MPFEGVDPWRWQYFEGVFCPDSVVIPCDDPTGWRVYPRHRDVYSKLFICDSQGIPNGPHGVMAKTFPVFSKPVMNLHGMGIGGRVIRSAAELAAHFTPGHMWMELLTGPHVSTDVALADGRPRWWRHATGKTVPGGMFDYWTVHARRRPRLERYLERWGDRYLRGLTGIVNFETIGGKIIECHLRMGSEQWVDINGPGWLESVVELSWHGRWQFSHRAKTGYSVALFGRHEAVYTIDLRAVEKLRRAPGVSSIQITFDPAKPRAQHAMPPGGFRLAIVNCWSLRTGLAIRERLKGLFTIVSLNGQAGRPWGHPARRAPVGAYPATARGR